MNQSSSSNRQDQKFEEKDLLFQTYYKMSAKTKDQRFEIARRHLLDAIYYRSSRNIKTNTDLTDISLPQRIMVKIKQSHINYYFLMLLSYIFMSLIFITFKRPGMIQTIVQSLILMIYWFNLGVSICYKKFQILRSQERFRNKISLKFIILTILTIDELIAIFQEESQNFTRPFLVFRCCLPLLYHASLRKNFQALIAIYKDLFVYMLFYGLVVLFFTFYFHSSVDTSKIQKYDEYKQNFGNFGRTIFVTYALSTYQGFPDREIKIFKIQPTFKIVILIYLFLNVFFFTQIPTSLLFKDFIKKRSKLTLIDMIKQKNSLILAFLCLCDERLKLPCETFGLFLQYCFRNKPGYINNITQILIQTDKNRNQFIQLCQFMQICQIMQSKNISPPIFDDWQPWVRFRRLINSRIYLKTIVQSKQFKICTSIFVFLSIANVGLSIFVKYSIFSLIDQIVVGVCFIQLLIKLIGLGPENYFKDPWNSIDFLVILIFVSLFLAPIDSFAYKLGFYLKIIRLYRVFLLIYYLAPKESLIAAQSLNVKISRLFIQIFMVFPVVFEFFPLLLIFFYFFGVLGLELYGCKKQTYPAIQSPYSKYDEILNFRSFLFSQFFMLQVLVSSGWSEVCFDYAYRFKQVAQAQTIIFFILTHLVVAVIIKSLIKGVIWQVYQKIHEQFDKKNYISYCKMRQQNRLAQKKQNIAQIEEQIKLDHTLSLQNLISREIFEMKVDFIIKNNIKFIQNKHHNNKSIQKLKSIPPQLSHMIKLQKFQSRKNYYKKYLDQICLKDLSKENIVRSDIDKEVQKLISNAIFASNFLYTHIIVYPTEFTDFLKQKLIKIPHPLSQQYQEQFHSTQNAELIISSYVSSIKGLMKIKSKKKKKKQQIISYLACNGLIRKQLAIDLMTGKINANENIELKKILRKMFLPHLKEQQIKQIQLSYFHSICGYQFLSSNKTTLLLLLEKKSKFIYCLSNLLRYKQVPSLEFFNILTKIQEKISKQLLNPRSFFKFVYQINCVNDTWFTIEVSEATIRHKFLKTGIWLQNDSVAQNQIYYGRDFFYSEKLQKSYKDSSHEAAQMQSLSKYLKLCYQNTETLALSIKQHEMILQPNPRSKIEDLYFFQKQTKILERGAQEKISKIMAIIINNCGQRIVNGDIQVLNYELTDMKLQNQRVSFHQPDKKYKKNMNFMKECEYPGLSHAYILNLLAEIRDILSVHMDHFVGKIQDCLGDSEIVFQQSNPTY